MVHSTQEDPIGLAGGLNLYGYGAGDPVNNADPFGLCPKSAGGDGKNDETTDCPRGSSGWWANREAAGEGPSAVNNTLGSFAALWEALNDDQCPECVKGVFTVPTGGRISLSDAKAALRLVHSKVGKLPKGKPGKFGSPQRGTPQRGYRLDPAHPNRPPGDPEAGPHINWWDYVKGKRGRGGDDGAVPIPPT